MKPTPDTLSVCESCGVLFDDEHPHTDCAKRHICGRKGDDDGTCEGCQNARKLDQADADAKAFAVAARKQPFVFEGADLRAELRRFCRLPAFKGHLKRVPPMRVRWGSTHWKDHVSGHAKTWSGRFVITVNPKSTLAYVLEVILHELVHVSLPPAEWHGDAFILRLARAAREAWDIEVPRPLETDAKGYVRAYEVDEKIRKALQAKFDSDPTSLPPRVPAPAPIDLASRRAALVAKRAAHALRMLEVNERKAKRLAKLVAKWRAKVRYYERAVAAKRGSSST